MKYFFLVTEVNTTEDFFYDSLGLFFLNGIVFRVDELFEIVLEEVEDDFEVLFNGFVDDIT